MGKTKTGFESSKKAIGNARKAEALDKKREAEDAKLAASEAAEWSVGAKEQGGKKEAEAAKKAELARKKAEREALLKEEEASLPTKPLKSKQRGQEKIATRRTGKIDDFVSGNEKEATLNATGIDNALDALTISTGGLSDKSVDRHPERRFKAAYAAYEDRRLPELKEEHPGLRLNQMKELIHKEFEKSPENPFNQVNVGYNASKSDVQSKINDVKRATEKKLA